MTYYAKLGYEIFIPVDSSRIDFIAYHADGYSKKVQVKTLGHRRYKDTVYEVAILTTKRNGQVEAYSPAEIDEFFVSSPDKCWVIPNSQVFPAKTIMLGSSDPQYKPRHNWNVKTWRVEA